MSSPASTKPIGSMGTVSVSTGGSGQLVLEWPTVAGADEYDVFHSTGTTMPSTPSQTVSAATATVGDLVNGTTYRFWVRGKNADGESNASAASTGIPIANASSPSLIAGDAQITASWTAIAGATQYEIFHSTDINPPQTASLTVNVPTTTATISGLVNGSTYNVWVRGRNSLTSGAISSPANAKPISSMGTVTVNTGSNGQLVLSWPAAAGADEYDVYHSTDTTIPADPSQTVSTTTATVSDLENGTMYFVWVKAKNFGAENTSAAASGRPIGTPGTPAIGHGAGQLPITWTAVAGADEYEVYYGTTSTPTTLALTTEETTAIISGLTNNTTYYVRLRAKNTNGVSGFGPVASETPSAFTVPPQAPVAPAVVNSNEQIDISWTVVDGAITYEVWFGTENSTASATKYGDYDSSLLSAAINGLDNGTTYYIWLRAKNDSGVSGFSALATGKPIADAAAPSLTAGNSQISVSWATIAGADQYEVFHNTDTNPPQTASLTIDTPATTATIAGLVNGTAYNVWVRGINSNGTGDISSLASATPLGIVGPVTVSAGDGWLSLSWDSAIGAEQYEVYYNTANTIPASPSQTVSTTTATISGLTNGTIYYIWVKGINSSGETTSAVVSAKSIAVPEEPVLYPGVEQLVVTWTAIAGADEYEVYYGTTSMPTTLATTTAATFATISGLTPDTAYYVRLRAKNANGVSDYGPSASASPIENQTAGLYFEGGRIGNHNLSEALDYISANAVNGGNYHILVGGSPSISPQSLSYAGRTVGITLSGLGSTTRNIWLSSNGSMFTIGSGVTLTLGENIRLLGLSDNNASLVLVNSGGTLIMNTGSGIQQNRNNLISTSSLRGGGGVYVKYSGSFTMNGGSISGNTVNSTTSSYAHGGGVFVEQNGSFRMNGGNISSNTVSITPNSGVTYYAPSGGGVLVEGSFIMVGGTISSNIATATTFSGRGGGVSVQRPGTFTMGGGEISGNWARNTVASPYYTYAFGGGVYVASGLNRRDAIFTKSISGNISGNSVSIATGGSGVARGSAVFAESYSSDYRDTSLYRDTAVWSDQINTQTGRGLSASGHPPFGQ